MPFEVMMIAVTAIITAGVTAVIIAALITRTIQSKRKNLDAGSGGSLTQSELRRLLSEVIAEATDPLYAKVGAIERQLDEVGTRLPPAEREAPLRLEAHEEKRREVPSPQ